MFLVDNSNSGVRRQMWWKNTRIMALSAVVGVVSRKNSYMVVQALIEQILIRSPIPVGSLSPIGAILRTHFRVMPIVRFIPYSRMRRDCTAPINIPCTWIMAKGSPIGPLHRPVSSGVANHHCPPRMKVETPKSLYKMPRETALAQAHSRLEGQQ
jgi:hypothetical protein